MPKSKGLRKPYLPPLTSEEVRLVACLYAKESSTVEIAEKLGWNVSRVRSALKVAQVTLRTRSVGVSNALKKGRMRCHFKGLKGAKHPAGKNGRRITEAGYVDVWCSEHPRAHHGYVFEHILVWEKHNGSIPVGLEIHHKDSNKQNNVLSNFELLTRSEHSKKEWQIALKRRQDMLERGFGPEQLTRFGYLKKSS